LRPVFIGCGVAHVFSFNLFGQTRLSPLRGILCNKRVC
jgi:hypothetical protein